MVETSLHLQSPYISDESSGHCWLLNMYKARISTGISDVCPSCGLTPHFVEHPFNCLIHPTQLTVQDVWDNPAAVADFLNLDNWRKELLDYHNNNNSMKVYILWFKLCGLSLVFIFISLLHALRFADVVNVVSMCTVGWHYDAVEQSRCQWFAGRGGRCLKKSFLYNRNKWSYVAHRTHTTSYCCYSPSR